MKAITYEQAEKKWPTKLPGENQMEYINRITAAMIIYNQAISDMKERKREKKVKHITNLERINNLGTSIDALARIVHNATSQLNELEKFCIKDGDRMAMDYVGPKGECIIRKIHE